MIFGHVGVAYAIRNARRGAPLAPLIVASILPDVANYAVDTAHVADPYDLYSHSLPAVAVLAAAAFLVTIAISRNRGVALAMAAAVILHLPPDWITGEKVLWLHGPVVGQMLYLHPAWDFALEAGVIVAGWLVLRRDPRAPRWAASAVTLALLIAGQAFYSVTSWEGLPP